MSRYGRHRPASQGLRRIATAVLYGALYWNLITSELACGSLYGGNAPLARGPFIRTHRKRAMSAYNQDVIPSKAVYMQRIADFVRLGYQYWTAGEIHAHRAARLADKFRTYYRVDLDRNRRARAKQHGNGCAVLLMHPLDAVTLHWLLLVTPGEHPAHKLEQLRDASSRRIRFDAYELVRHTRKGQSTPSWTWRLSDEAYEAWRDRIRATVRSGTDDDLRQLIQSLHRMPGFAGNRAQGKSLQRLLRGEWRRIRRTPPPMLPRLWYLRRLPVDAMPLALWLKRAGAAEKLAAASANDSQKL